MNYCVDNNLEMSANPVRVCAVITEETVESARAALKDAEQTADLAEVRLDYIQDFDFSNPENLGCILDGKRLPVIITCRSVEEGGRRPVDNRLRLRLLVEGVKRFADYCDIEGAHYREAASLSPDLSKTIVSYHNFEETPADLGSIYQRISMLPAAVHKIVSQANRIDDSLAILKLLDLARGANRRLIALAMGEAGLITRVLGPSRGSFLTYGSLKRGSESASGQPTCAELKRSYRVHQIRPQTAVAGIVGKPVGHSASPAMHNAAFNAVGIDGVYLPLEVDDFSSFISRFVRFEAREIDWRLCGLSVTIPHKRAAFTLIDEVDDVARAVGAVNTIVVREDGHLAGFNTDVDGGIEPLKRLTSLRNANCAVIGAGGSARALVFGLLKEQATVTVFARNPERARLFGKEFSVPVMGLDAISASDAEILINATPVGMTGHSEGISPVPPDVFHGRRVAYDLVYNPMETRFLADARNAGCRTVSGIEMLVSQAAHQFRLWTTIDAPLEVMREAAVRRIEERS